MAVPWPGSNPWGGDEAARRVASTEAPWPQTGGPMKLFLLGLLGLILIIPRVTLLSIALVVVGIASQLERLEEWIAIKRGLPIVQVGVDDCDHDKDTVCQNCTRRMP
jgi:hypothetical protein